MQRFRPILQQLTKLFNKHVYIGDIDIGAQRNIHLRRTEIINPKQYRTQKVSMSSNVQDSLIVHHDAKANKFFIKLGEDEAKLEYTKQGDVWNMWHTEVPPPLQGKGIAKILAKEAFDHVVKNNLKMSLSCTYLQKYYNDNPKPEYTERIVS